MPLHEARRTDEVRRGLKKAAASAGRKAAAMKGERRNPVEMQLRWVRVVGDLLPVTARQARSAKVGRRVVCFRSRIPALPCYTVEDAHRNLRRQF